MSAFRSFKHVKSLCPQCGYQMDGSTHVQGGNPSLPEPGDSSVCINCGQVLIYESDRRLRKAEAKEINELMSENPQGWAVIEKAQMFIRKRGRFK